ncbi:MAG: hypothetical protein R2706_10085 [Acidimicrobiales bacterium]
MTVPPDMERMQTIGLAPSLHTPAKAGVVLTWRSLETTCGLHGVTPTAPLTAVIRAHGLSRRQLDTAFASVGIPTDDEVIAALARLC